MENPWENSNNTSQDFTKKRKKKKSLLQQAKKFGKKGRFGRGQDIEASTYNYFVQVLETLNLNQFEDDESKEIFVANVFASNSDNEEILCCNQLVSRIYEKLLPLAENSVKFRLMNKLGEDVRKFASNSFASHVLERLLWLGSFQQKSDVDSDDQEFEIQRKEWVLKVAKYSLNNFQDFASDIYASHILKTSFQCLAGLKLSSNMLKSKKAQSQAQSNLDICPIRTETCLFKKEDVKEVFEMATKKILDQDSNSLQEWCQTETSSSVLQCLLSVLSKFDPKMCKKVAKYITNEIFSEKLSDFAYQEPKIRLLETLIEVSASDESMEKVHKHLFTTFFKGNIRNQCDGKSNQIFKFSIQKLIQSCVQKEMFEEIYETELDENINIFLESSSGILLAIAQTCKRLKVKQAHFLVALMKSLECQENPEKQNKFLFYLTKLQKSSEFSEETPVNLHGTLIAQEILHFNKPIKLVNSILASDSEKLCQILSDPRGCHITDAFMTSSTIGEKSRESFIKVLQQNGLVSMACSKHGSRGIDAIWNNGSIKLKEFLAAKLSSEENKLNSNQYGKFVSQNLGLNLFKRSKENWKSNFDKAQKTKALFNDFIKSPPLKSSNAEQKSEESSKKLFVLDTQGNPELLKKRKQETDMDIESTNNSELPVEKKKKKSKKSYLDDL